MSPHRKQLQISHEVKQSCSFMLRESAFLQHNKLHHDDERTPRTGTMRAQASWGLGTCTWARYKATMPSVSMSFVSVKRNSNAMAYNGIL